MSEKVIAKGDLIGVDGATGNHGCMNYAVLRYLGENQAKVIEAQSCHSCWQVGHDADYVFAQVDDVQEVNVDALVEAERSWRTDVQWETTE